jgi:hypothetical protein
MVIVRRFFDKVGMSGSKAQLFNGVALLVVFFFSRSVQPSSISYVASRLSSFKRSRRTNLVCVDGYRLVLGNYTSYQLFMLSFEDGVRQKAGARLLNTIRILDLLLSGLHISVAFMTLAFLSANLRFLLFIPAFHRPKYVCKLFFFSSDDLEKTGARREPLSTLLTIQPLCMLFVCA